MGKAYIPLHQMTKAERHQKRIERRLNTCIHHNGTINEKCDAGIVYTTVGETVDLGRDGMPFVAACYRNYEWAGHRIECNFTCEKQEFPTLEEVEKDIAETDAALAIHLEQIANDICPTHNIAITKRQVGKCVYAEPCGCRLYQGRLKK